MDYGYGLKIIAMFFLWKQAFFVPIKERPSSSTS